MAKTRQEFNKIGQNKRIPVVEVEEKNGDFFVFFPDPLEDIVLGVAITVTTDPKKGEVGTIEDVDSFIKKIKNETPPHKPQVSVPIRIKMGDTTINLTVV